MLAPPTPVVVVGIVQCWWHRSDSFPLVHSRGQLSTPSHQFYKRIYHNIKPTTTSITPMSDFRIHHQSMIIMWSASFRTSVGCRLLLSVVVEAELESFHCIRILVYDYKLQNSSRYRYWKIKKNQYDLPCWQKLIGNPFFMALVWSRSLVAKRQRGTFRLHVGSANTQWSPGTFSPIP